VTVIVTVNGEAHEVPPDTTIAEVLALLRAPSRGVAVAVDGEVVPRGAWESTKLPDGASVEVLAAIQGG
jgi:sulfur carrier protein